MDLSGSTPFWYGGSDRSIVALTRSREGVELSLSWPCEDRPSASAVLTWEEFRDMAADVAAIVGVSTGSGSAPAARLRELRVALDTACVELWAGDAPVADRARHAVAVAVGAVSALLVSMDKQTEQESTGKADT